MPIKNFNAFPGIILMLVTEVELEWLYFLDLLD